MLCTLTATARVCHRTRLVFDHRPWLVAAVLAAGVACLPPSVAQAGGKGLCATAAAEHSVLFRLRRSALGLAVGAPGRGGSASDKPDSVNPRPLWGYALMIITERTDLSERAKRRILEDNPRRLYAIA